MNGLVPTAVQQMSLKFFTKFQQNAAMDFHAEVQLTCNTLLQPAVVGYAGYGNVGSVNEISQ